MIKQLLDINKEIF